MKTRNIVPRIFFLLCCIVSLITAADVLSADQSLGQGQSLTSLSGKNELRFQDDGNICLYYRGIPLWCTWTIGKNPDRLTMQADGNLVVYDTSNRPIWNSGTAQYSGQNIYMRVEDYGNMVVYANWIYRWATKTRRYRYIAFKNDARDPMLCYPLLKNGDGNREVWKGHGNWGLWQGSTFPPTVL